MRRYMLLLGILVTASAVTVAYAQEENTEAGPQGASESLSESADDKECDCKKGECRRDGKGGPEGRRGPGGDHRRPHGPPPKPEEVFEKMDGDGDGKVTLEEFMAHHEEFGPPPPPPHHGRGGQGGRGYGPPPHHGGEGHGPPPRGGDDRRPPRRGGR